MKRSLLALSACLTLGMSVTGAAQAPRVDVCHVNGSGAFQKITVNRNAVQAHRGHGDALPGEAVPGQAGYSFDATCTPVQPQPNFVPFYIRNNNSTISAPWDADISIVENASGDGFTALTPRGGQKVGYGTHFFDGIALKTLESVDWVKISGKVGIVSYLNIWVTDGINFAVIASENDYRGTDFQTRTEWKVFETNVSNLDWLCASGPGTRSSQYLQCNGVNVTLADISANITIKSPTFPWPNVGTGAPRGGYGFNLIYGDTQSNFVGSYQLENLSITVGGMTFFAQ